MKHYLGIDPGKKGSYSVINENGYVERMYRMPLMNYNPSKVRKSDIDAYQIFDDFRAIVNEFSPVKAIIEKAQAMPGQGTVSMFSYGRVYGILVGLLVASDISWGEVHPRVWTKALFEGIGLEGKDRNYAAAKRIFPNWHPQFKYEKDWADSLLLAEYARRKSA